MEMEVTRYKELCDTIQKIRGCNRLSEEETTNLEMALFTDREEFEMFSAIENEECRKCDCGYYVEENKWNKDIDCCEECAANDDHYQSYIKKQRAYEAHIDAMLDARRGK